MKVYQPEENVIQRIQNAARFVDSKPSECLNLLIATAFHVIATSLEEVHPLPSLWKETMMKLVKNREKLTAEEIKAVSSTIKACQKFNVI